MFSQSFVRTVARTAIVTAMLAMFAAAKPSHAITLQEAQLALAFYQQQEKIYCPLNATVCAQIRQAINHYKALVKQLTPTTPTKPPAADPCDKTRQMVEYYSNLGRNRALAYVRSTKPGKNGYTFYYWRPPVYCGQSYTRAARPYNATAYEAVRVINMLSNNGNYIDGYARW